MILRLESTLKPCKMIILGLKRPPKTCFFFDDVFLLVEVSLGRVSDIPQKNKNLEIYIVFRRS